jgi:hypothetical protein
MAANCSFIVGNSCDIGSRGASGFYWRRVCSRLVPMELSSWGEDIYNQFSGIIEDPK